MKNNYTTDSIKSYIDEVDAIRKRPASIGIENHNSLFVEVLANSIDESREGYGNLIEVEKKKDLSIIIKDLGRGIPLGKDSTGEYVYPRVLCKLWSGGKMDNNSEKGGYLYSLGVNGCGLKATNFCSDIFQCVSYRDGKKFFIEYQKGRQQYEIQENKFDYDNTGTVITWKPSLEVFRTGNDTDKNFITTILKQQAIVNKGLKLTFKDEMDNSYNEFYYENGIIDYIKEIGQDKNISDIIYWTTETEGKDKTKNNTDNEFNKNYKIKCNIAFTFNNEHQLMEYYHNGSYLENGGTPEDFIKNAFVYTIDKYLESNKMYDKKDDKKIKYEDVKDSLIIVSDTYSTISLYTDQAKKKIDSDLMKRYMTDYLKEQLYVYFTENPLEAKNICATVLNNARANLKADKTKQEIKKKLQEGVKSAFGKIEGLTDCSKNTPFEEKEIWLCEGLSACSTLTDSRDDKTMATFALRGRFINSLKSTVTDVLKNAPAYGIIQALGCGIEAPSEERNKFKGIELFDKSKLKFSKVIIATDADSFGHGITLSLLAFFYRFMPTLLKEGRIYISVSPRYQIVYKNTLYFAYSEDEKNEIVKKYSINPNSNQISVIKGLGQLNKEVFWNHVMNPENRILKRVIYEDFKNEDEIQFYFDTLIGEDIINRKDYVKEFITNPNINEIE